MGRSFGLAAYRAWSRRLGERTYKATHDRPGGSLVWIHAPEDRSLLAIQDLAQNLRSIRPDISILITLPETHAHVGTVKSWPDAETIFIEQAPSENPEAIASFWDHWSPQIGIWAWGRLRPNLLSKAHQENCAMLLIDADTGGFDGRRDRWLPDLSRQLLQPFIALMVRSSAAVQRLEALGLPTHRIDLTPPLEASGRALPCNEAFLSDLSERLHGRPVWFANKIAEDEITAILAAHREALRLSHRLMLILHLAQPDLKAAIMDRISDEGFRMADWDQDEEFDDSTQVLVSTDDGDLGLFYRASPVVFMGSSLIPNLDVGNPFDAAALGSAIIYGPNVKAFSPFFTRLAKAGAARIVKDQTTLGSAVVQMIAPDQAAAMAHAGWDVVSQGADLTDRVTDLVQAVLDGDFEATYEST